MTRTVAIILMAVAMGAILVITLAPHLAPDDDAAGVRHDLIVQ